MALIQETPEEDLQELLEGDLGSEEGIPEEALEEEAAPTEAGGGQLEVSPDQVSDVAGLEVGETITFTVTEVLEDGRVMLAPTGSEEEAIPVPEPGAGAETIGDELLG